MVGHSVTTTETKEMGRGRAHNLGGAVNREQLLGRLGGPVESWSVIVGAEAGGFRSLPAAPPSVTPCFLLTL